ncbi:MAG: hypothetical protein KUG74_01555 [Rhodobacteraceae bacterium]|nr:hypothetical protein [Paracoccaceae bacterium]
MTIVTLDAPLNLITTTLWDGDLVSYSATEIVVSDGTREGTFSGGFTFNIFTGEVFGTLDSFVTTSAGSPEYSFTDMNLDANDLFNAIDGGDIPGAFNLVLGGDDTFYGSSGRDILFADTGNDLMKGNGGRDSLKGQAGADKLVGGSGKDKLFGGNGNDTLDGGSFSDKLFGGNGRDKMIGGKGADLLSGGAHKDTFVFNDISGNDEITDFQVGLDLLKFKTDLEVEATAADGGTSVLLEWGSNSVLLDGVTLEEYLGG